MHIYEQREMMSKIVRMMEGIDARTACAILGASIDTIKENDVKRRAQEEADRKIADIVNNSHAFQNGGEVTSDVALQYALAQGAIQRVADGAVSAIDMANAVFHNASIDPEIKVMMIKEMFVNRKLGRLEDIQPLMVEMNKMFMM